MPDPQVEQLVGPEDTEQGLGETSEAHASRSHKLGWQERGAGRGWAKVLPGILHRLPHPHPLCSPEREKWSPF